MAITPILRNKTIKLTENQETELQLKVNCSANNHIKKEKPADVQRVLILICGERGSQTYGFLEYHKNTQMVIYQLFIKFAKNQDITKYLSVSQFLGVKLGVDFEATPRRMKS